MALNLCNAFKDIEEFLPDSLSSESNDTNRNLYKIYCPIDQTGKQECRTDGERIGAMFKLLLQQLFVNNEDALELENKNDEYSEYAILWLSNIIKNFNYKNNMHVLDFYTTIIKEEKSKELVDKEIKVFEDEHYCNALLNLKKFYAKFTNGNNTNVFPKINEIKKMNNCKKLCEGANSSWKVIHVEVKDAVTKENVNEGKQPSEKKPEEPIPVGTTELNIAPPNTVDVPINGIIELKVGELKTNLDTILSKKSELIGIGVIAILTPIISAILYKYWFVGWRKKAERKKSVKKVINLAVGTNLPKQL
ncbi:Plasmodium variant antigen protein Cir/Yir/Bir, putative [Plasmodium chabaudi adami]|uniref:Plasmodium variant antigen protein Cir/Yir/Bir, putative n=1 Tax=Plasmodium chabaudi adami TaxID=5826 RepID=A0A1C6WB19_PLACE|nr:Plasmodium variant antigen protein Cir/Yir/Bir, putative [Plasmodium chabaudi adami]